VLIAADGCHLGVARVLVASGADLTDIDRSNANCLHLAVRGPRERCPPLVEEFASKGGWW
jgi:ankyrin repeat protein